MAPARDAPERRHEREPLLGERLLFTAYLLVIVAGLVLFFLAGINHR